MTLFLILAIAGAAAGVVSHYLLRRICTTVHMRWCVVGVAALWGLTGWQATRFNLPWWWLPIPLLVAWLAVPLALVDLKHRRLPNALTLSAYPATAATVALAATQTGDHTAKNALLGATILGGSYLAIHLMSPTAMGGGDVKLSGTQGAVMGAAGLPAILIGTTLAALLTLALKAVSPKRVRNHWQTGTPHGPALLAATYVTALFPAIQK